MPLLSLLARMFLLRRLFGQGRGRGHRGYGRRHRRSGFGTFGPFPTYSPRTRGGSRVSVGGCCLPIPLALAVSALGGGALRRRRR